MTVAPDYAQSVAFLQRWSPEGPWSLTAIRPDRKAIDGRTFTELSEVTPWLENYGGDRNVYFSVNPVIRPIADKANRDNIAAMAWLHVDIDPVDGKDIAAEQQRALTLLQTPPAGVPAPTCIVFSGGGYQGFWRLESSYAINGEEDRFEDAKRWNQQLELVFGGDHCHNVDRIMRLPGTVNRPDPKKAAKGRTAVLAELVDFNDNVYGIGEFTPAEKVQDEAGFTGGTVKLSGNVARYANVDELPSGVSDACRVVIVQGRNMDDPERHGESRSEWLHWVCCELVRAGMSDDDIYSVITDPEFLISASVLDKGSNIERYAARQIERAKEKAIDPWLMKLNEKHAVISSIGGKCRILSEEYDPVTDRQTTYYQTAADFKLRYCNQAIEYVTAKGTVEIPVGQWWISNSDRRQFDTVVFAPGRDVQGSYNLWKGFAFDAKPGSCTRFLAHVHDNVCAGDDVIFQYLMGWMASAVQHPDSPGHTAVVMRGDQGTGKSFFAKAFGALFGRHFLQIANSSHLVGNFNAHLRDCVVVFGDEAFYAGDKRHEGVLKMLVTEEMFTLEGKGVDVEAARNYTHVILASNDEWVVPAGLNERRFLVLDVAEHNMQDRVYFEAIRKELDGGGYEALLHHLMTYDLTGYDVRALPKTAALQDQKMFSFSPEEEWWYGKLSDGEIAEGEDWPTTVLVTNLTQDYVREAQKWQSNDRGNRTRLGRFLCRVVPDGHKLKVQLSGEHEVMMEGGQLKKVQRPRAYQLPPLEICRAHWDRHFGGPFNWPQPTLVHGKEGPDEAF